MRVGERQTFLVEKLRDESGLVASGCPVSIGWKAAESRYYAATGASAQLPGD